MSDIKMSDVVELPIDPNDMLIDSDIAKDDSDRGFLELAAEAINTYDANQELISNLEQTIEQQQVMLNFQSAQYNVIVDLGIKREKEIINLKRKISNLEEELITEQELHASIIKFAEKSSDYPICGLSLK